MNTSWWIGMKKEWLRGMIVALGALVLILAVGCSNDEKNGDNGLSSRDLSAEEQLAVIEGILDMDLDLADGDSVLIAAPIVSAQAGQVFWDGVDSLDILTQMLSLVSFGGSVTASSIQGHGKANEVATRALSRLTEWGDTQRRLLSKRADTADSLFFGVQLDFDDESGWWELGAAIYVELQSADTSILVDIQFIDSVRFYNSATEEYPEEPGPTTDQVEQVSRLLGEIVYMAGDDELNMNLNISSSSTTAEQSAEMIVLNGGSTVTLSISGGVTYVDEETEEDLSGALDGDITLTAMTDDVMFEMPEEVDDPICPTSGSMNGSVNLDATVTTDDEQGTAEGTWQIDIEFLGDGQADIALSFGTFQKQALVNVCE